MKNARNVSASSQDYLEAIWDLSQKNEKVKSVDVSDLLGVTRASTNRAMGILKENGMITQQRYSDICLTEKGRREALNVRERHDVLKTFLIDVLHVNVSTAEADACKMEHAISSETFDKFKAYVKQVI